MGGLDEAAQRSLSVEQLCADRLAGVDFDGSEPAEAVGFEAVGDAEEFVGDFLGDIAGFSVGDDDVVDGADGRDLGGCAGEKDLVGDIEQFTGDGLLDDGVAEVAGDGDNAVAGDAGESRVAELRSVENAAADYEDVLARALADQSVDIQGDALLVAVDLSLHMDELGVHVVCAGLGERGHSVGGETIPTGDANVSAAVAGDVLAPGKVGDVDLDGRTLGADANFTIAAERDGADVARGNLIGFNHIDDGRAELVKREGDLHAVDFG